MNFGLDENTINKINSVFENHSEIEEVFIYGSRAKGNFRNGSDTDITLKGKTIPSKILSRLKQEIDELNTPYMFDISIFETLESSELINHINKVGRIFYKKQK